MPLDLNRFTRYLAFQAPFERAGVSKFHDSNSLSPELNIILHFVDNASPSRANVGLKRRGSDGETENGEALLAMRSAASGAPYTASNMTSEFKECVKFQWEFNHNWRDRGTLLWDWKTEYDHQN